MSVKNYYPSLPILPYQKTSVKMDEVIKYLASLPIDKELKRVTYCIFRTESANGKSGVNNNYGGFQSDSGKWQDKYDKYFAGVCIKKENQTGKERGFLCFTKWQDSVDILADKLQDRGIYIGGTTHLITKFFIKDSTDLADAYCKEWVHGNADYKISLNELMSFTSMYAQAKKLFI